MAQSSSKPKKSKNKKIFRSILALILVFSTIYSVRFIIRSRYKTILPEPDILYRKVEAEAVAIKNETLYIAEGTGEIDQRIKEGEMVPVGVEIANINLLKDNSGLKQELLEIEQKIEALSKSNKDVAKIEEEKSEIETTKADLIDTIQRNINEGNYTEVFKAKEDMLFYDSKLQDSSIDNTLIGVSIENLQARREELLNQIGSNNQVYYTQNAGIVTYNIDGFENIYKAKDFENYTYDKLNFADNNIESNKEQNVNIGKPIFKIIDNFEWFLAIKVENKNQIEQYEVGQAMTIELEDGNELVGRIKNINITGSNAVVILSLNTYLHENYNIRFVNLEIINFRKETYKIPTSVIVEKEGRKGVYIKEINGIVKFRPILILDVIDEYAYIEKGNNNGYVKFEGDEKEVRTITLYDEIFLDPSAVKEGQILK